MAEKENIFQMRPEAPGFDNPEERLLAVTRLSATCQTRSIDAKYIIQPDLLLNICG